MKTKIRTSFFNAKLRAFLFFLLLATIFWVLTRFSKQESATVKAKLEYINVPKGKLLLTSNKEEVAFTLEANKFEILYYRIKRPKIVIDLEEFYSVKSKDIIINEDVLESLLIAQISSGLVVNRVKPKELIIALESLNFKDVPVEIVANLKYESGFGASGAYIVEPSTVTITGAKQYLDTITSVKTVLIEENDVEKSLHLKIPLAMFDSTKVKVSPKTISFKQKVVEFSQKEVVLNINVINGPSDATLRLLPNNLKILFTVPVENFSAITAEDFTVTVDYNNRNKTDNFIVPEITRQPAGIRDVKLDIKKVDLLLFK